MADRRIFRCHNPVSQPVREAFAQEARP
jgi:hypothetical protein